MSLWKKESSPRTRSLNKNLFQNQGTSLCTCSKASFTVEAAIVIPLTAGFLAVILFIFRILQVQVAVDEALIYAGRSVAVESSVISSESALLLSAEAFMVAVLEEYPVVEEYVENGILGISLLNSELSGDKITLKATYRIKLPVGFFELDGLSLYSQNSSKKWTGNLGEDGDSEWVYITTYGTVYHATKSCQAIDINVKETTLPLIEDLRGDNGQKYYACSSCKESIKAEIVYYTDYGTLYHGDISCSALKRTVKKVLLSEVGDRGRCSFCYQNQ